MVGGGERGSCRRGGWGNEGAASGSLVGGVRETLLTHVFNCCILFEQFQ